MSKRRTTKRERERAKTRRLIAATDKAIKRIERKIGHRKQS